VPQGSAACGGNQAGKGPHFNCSRIS